MVLTPEILDLLEKVRVAVREDRLAEAEQIMLRVRELLNEQIVLPRAAGW